MIRIPFSIIVALAFGCGSSAVDVSGTVRHQGKPIVFGTVVIIGSDGLPRSGAIQPDGSFTVANVKAGPAKVCVSSPRPPGLAVEGTKKKTGRDADLDERRPADADATVSPAIAKGWFPLPNIYGDPLTSGLTTDVAPGTPLDLDLK